MRIVLHIEYDGTRYCGWQVQKNGIAIQQKIGEAIFSLTGERTLPHASGRTDAGVHALCQVAHFDTQSNIPPHKFSLALNTRLPADIRILKSFAAQPQSFHARFDAKGKHYRYIIKNAPVAAAVGADYSMFEPLPLDLFRMAQGAALIEGTHDFAAFCAAGTNVKNTVRTVHRVKITKTGSYIFIDVYGNGFLYNMVRIIAGTLLQVGKHKISPAQITDILEGKDRVHAGATAPACGLFLVEVFYGEQDI